MAFDTDHHQHLLQSGLLKTNYGDMCDRYYGFQTEAGKSADPRLMRVLEFFRELYIRKRETFRKLVPQVLHEGYVELFKRISSLLTKANYKPMHGARTLHRSLSAGSELKLERFRVRAVNAGHGAGGGGGGGNVQSIGQGGQGDKPKVASGSK